MKRHTLILTSLLAIAATPAFAQLSASDYDSTPAFVETFAGGAPVGEWIIDPEAVNALPDMASHPPQFLTATPGGIDGDFVSADPVGSSDDGGVMAIGNASATSGTLFGLNYVQCVNSQAGGSGTDFTTLTDYRIVARVWLPASSFLAPDDRYQVGPYIYGGNLFRPSVWYNNGSSGGGPGFSYRGMTTGDVVFSSGALTAARWTLMSVMVRPTGDPNLTEVAVVADTNGDGTLDEGDPAEYVGGLFVDTTPGTGRGDQTTFGFFTVGVVSSDVYPMFIDSVELYLPGGSSSVEAWHIYE